MYLSQKSRAHLCIGTKMDHRRATDYHLVPAQTDLGPVGEDLAIATICDQLLGELSHTGIQVVHHHVHDGCCLSGPGWVLVNRVGPDTHKPVITLSGMVAVCCVCTSCAVHEWLLVIHVAVKLASPIFVHS